MKLLFLLLSYLLFLKGTVEATEGYRLQKIEHLQETQHEPLKEAYDQAIRRLEIEESHAMPFEDLRQGLCFGKVAALFWFMEQKGSSPAEAVQKITLEDIVYWQVRQRLETSRTIPIEQPEIGARKGHDSLLPWKEKYMWLPVPHKESSYFDYFSWLNLFWTLDEYPNNILGRIGIPGRGNYFSHTFTFWRWNGIYGGYDQQNLIEFDDKEHFFNVLISNINSYYDDAEEFDYTTPIRIYFEELPPSLR